MNHDAVEHKWLEVLADDDLASFQPYFFELATPFLTFFDAKSLLDAY